MIMEEQRQEFYLGGYIVSLLSSWKDQGAFDGQSFQQEFDEAVLDANRSAFPRINLTVATKALQHLARTSDLPIQKSHGEHEGVRP